MNNRPKVSLANLAVIFAFTFTCASLALAQPLSVIPGENPNFNGMTTPAGSGRHLDVPITNICRVTNLNDAGAGSFRYCIEEAPSPKTVIFEVSGTIQLANYVTLGGFTGRDCATKGNYTTIAGQTAPSPGIVIRGGTFIIERNCHDILVQHLRFRRGDTESDLDRPDLIDVMTIVNSYDPARGWYPPERIVIANNSFSWGVDELLESSANNATFINNIFSEGLSRSIHPKGEHSKGLVLTGYGIGSQNVLVAGNLFALTADRNPKSSTGNIVFANNFIYDVGEAFRTEAIDPAKSFSLTAIVGNYIAETPKLLRSIYVLGRYDLHPETRHFIGPNNFYKGKIQTAPWENTTVCGNFGVSGGCRMPLEEHKLTQSAPIWPDGYTAMSALDAKQHVLTNSGARPADRDSVDTRVIAYVKSDSTNSPFVDCVDCSNKQCTGNATPRLCCTGAGTGTCNAAPGGWPTILSQSSPLEVPLNPHKIQPSGYTELEEWLHAFARKVEDRALLKPTNLRVTW